MQMAQCRKTPCCRWRRISRQKLYMYNKRSIL